MLFDLLFAVASPERPFFCQKECILHEDKVMHHCMDADSRTKPSQEDLYGCAKNIAELFQDGFQWSDLTSMMKIAISFLNSFSKIDVAEKREALVEILNYVISITDTPYLPDSYTDPLFKMMVPPFANLFVPDTFNEIFVEKPSANTFPTDEEVQMYAQKLIYSFPEGFGWNDLVTVFHFSIQFANQYPEATVQDKIIFVKKMYDRIIDLTDTPYLPEWFADPVFKAFAHPLIETLVPLYSQ